jgi:hypothetical protein
VVSVQRVARRVVRVDLVRVDLVLFAVSILVYGAVHYVGLTEFPIFFFCDEAIQTNHAADLLRRNLHGEDGVLLPPYFRNGGRWNLSLSVYLHAITVFFFGSSILVNRATSASVTILAGVAVAVMLRLVFRVRHWWAGLLALGALPVWFLHSRTSFETVLMVSFYACFLCAYLIYRYHDPRYLIAAIAFGAATFYSYANGQGVMAVSGLLLLLSDLRYHVRVLRDHSRLRALAVIVLGVAAVPYVRFWVLYPGALVEHLESMHSIWVRQVPVSNKLADFARNYVLGLSPGFWFLPDNGVDLARHTFKGWGNLPAIFLPPILVGLASSLCRWRSSAHRAVLIAILAAPFSAALVTVHNYRALALVVPAAILACLGIDRAAEWLIRRRVPATALAVACAAWLGGMNLVLLRVALVDGPTWYRDYGLYGMQYGAAQVFPAIAAELRASPHASIVVSPDWANNPNAFLPFFIAEELRHRVAFMSPNEYLTRKRELPPTTIYVLPASDHDAVRRSGKLEVDPPIRVIAYPDNRPGFFFVRMRYVHDIDDRLAAERAARRVLVQDTATIDGVTVPVRRSPIDLGTMADLFDDDPGTLIRGVDASPFVLDFAFPEPRLVRGLGLDVWPVDLQLTVTIERHGGGQPYTYTATYRDQRRDLHLDLDVSGAPILARAVRIELLDPNAEITKIHVAGVRLR